MKEAVAIAKEGDAKKDFFLKKSDKNDNFVRNESERQLGALMNVINNMRRKDDTPSVDRIATELSGMHTAERASVLLALQRTHGNRYVQRVVAGIQAKLKVGQTGDVYEQEADRVAEQAMQIKISGHEGSSKRLIDVLKRKNLTNTYDWMTMVSCLNDSSIPLNERATLAFAVQSLHGNQILTRLMNITYGGGSLHQYINGKSATHDEYNSEKLLEGTDQRALGRDQRDNASAERIADRVERGSKRGSSLDSGTLMEMESLLVSKFSDVRAHTDEESASLASALGVEAFTIGRDIFFARNKYQPNTNTGKWLMAHELAHIVQQQSATAVSMDMIKGRTCISTIEHEADRAATAIVHGLPMLVTTRVQSMALLGRACVSSANIPANRGGIVNSGGRVSEYFEMNIDWDGTGTNCNCSHGEYRQYVKGYAKINGVQINKPLYGGAFLSKTTYHEDGDGAGHRYGHRGDAGFATDVFSNPDRATGCRYRGRDQPGAIGPSGTAVDFKLTFKGQTYDTSTNTHGPINLWIVQFKGNIA